VKKYPANKLSKKEWINRCINIHGDRYDYSLVELNNAGSSKVLIICKIHGEFKQKIGNHAKGYNCPKCIGNQKSNTNEFIEKAIKIHNNKYDYSLVKYIDVHTKIFIICKTHGTFKQSPNSHLNGQRCPLCSSGRYSKMAIEWLNHISEEENIYIQHAENIGEYKIIETIIDNNKKTGVSADGYCKETNTIYEFLGDFWHGNPEVYLAEDTNPKTKKLYGESYQETMDRLELIKSLGYNVVYIWESDWNKI